MTTAGRTTSTDERSLVAFRTAIAEKYAAHIQAFEDADLESLLDRFFHRDAIWTGSYPSENTVLQGRNQLEEFFEHVIDCQLIDPIQSLFSYVDGNLGFDFAVYRTRPRPQYEGSNGPKDLRFHCNFNWVKVDGDWKVLGVTSYMTEVRAES